MKRFALTLIILGTLMVKDACAITPITDSKGNVIVDATGYMSLEGFNVFVNYLEFIESNYGTRAVAEVAFNYVAGATIPLTNAPTDYVVPRRVTALRRFVRAFKEIEYQNRAGVIGDQVASATDVIQFIAQFKTNADAQVLMNAINVLKSVKTSTLPYRSQLDNEIRTVVPEITPLPSSTPKPTATPTRTPTPTNP